MIDHAERLSAGEGAYSRIRRDIIFGHLPPGRRLKLDAVRQIYDVSVSTLREVLNRLCSEGMIIAEEQRGFEVAPVSAEGFREVAGLRLLLEGHALTESFAAGDLEWEGRVVAAYHKLQRLEMKMATGASEHAETWKRYDREFHCALISACGSDVLLEAHIAVYDKYLRYQMVADIYRGDVAAREHRHLLECALLRDAARGHETLIRHVEDCVEAALARGDAAWLKVPVRLVPQGLVKSPRDPKSVAGRESRGGAAPSPRKRPAKAARLARA